MIYIIGGVSGVGKTTIGRALAQELSVDFLDADDYHPQANIDKMSSGLGLNDDDRKPWLVLLNSTLKEYNQSGKSAVLACSALKESYRQLLATDLGGHLTWVFLHGDYDLIWKRMNERSHFMPPSLLKAQFADLEMPNDDILYDVRHSPDQIIDQILRPPMTNKADIGLIGLGVMGKSLARNIANKRYQINVYNRHVDNLEVDVAKQFVEAHDELSSSLAFDSIAPFIASLSLPRKVFLMVNAGPAVDSVIKELTPHLQAGDIIIDGGNSHYKDTQRRYDSLALQGIRYIGSGVSGGEEGALKGPSIMPGGSDDGYDEVSELLTAIAARDAQGKSCCTYIGRGGAGHFVKMVHNGIEYAEMQLIAEIYGTLRYTMQQSHGQISTLFQQWSSIDSGSYLLEISANILQQKEENGTYLIDSILDKAGNKGTGSWTTIAACELGVAIPTITAALFARYQSSYYDQRQAAAKLYGQHKTKLNIKIEDLRLAYQQARVINHHQGMALIAQASSTYDWDINLPELTRIWTNGCIIRSTLMQEISKSIGNSPDILANSELNAIMTSHPQVLAKIVSEISLTPLSTPCLSSALTYFNGYREARSLASMIQAQRDYFGAHTYERLDAPRGQKFHTQWS